MASSRFDPEQDLYGMIPRIYPDGPALPERSEKPRRPLTGRAGLEAGKRIEARAAEQKANELGGTVSMNGTSREQLDHDVDMIRRMKAGEVIGEPVVAQSVEVVEPLQPELPLE